MFQQQIYTEAELWGIDGQHPQLAGLDGSQPLGRGPSNGSSE
jgi:hypothetical protein